MFTLKCQTLVVHAQQVRAQGSPHHQTTAGPPDVCRCPSLERPHVHTLGGPVPVRDGDWIVTRAAGDRYVCAGDVFETTHEALVEVVGPQ